MNDQLKVESYDKQQDKLIELLRVLIEQEKFKSKKIDEIGKKLDEIERTTAQLTNNTVYLDSKKLTR